MQLIAQLETDSASVIVRVSWYETTPDHFAEILGLSIDTAIARFGESVHCRTERTGSITLLGSDQSVTTEDSSPLYIGSLSTIDHAAETLIQTVGQPYSFVVCSNEAGVSDEVQCHLMAALLKVICDPSAIVTNLGSNLVIALPKKEAVDLQCILQRFVTSASTICGPSEVWRFGTFTTRPPFMLDQIIAQCMTRIRTGAEFTANKLPRSA